MHTSLKTYLREHLRANLKTLLYITFFAVLFTLIVALDGQIVERYSYYYETYETVYYCNIGIPATVLCLSCYIAPVLEFSFFKKRRNLDCVYALPITRQSMGLAHFISGLLLVVIPYTLSYLANFLMLLRAPEGFYLTPLWGSYFAMLAIGISMYSLFVFVFNKANTKGDGIWFILLWTFVLSLVAETICYTWDAPYYNFVSDSGFGIPFAVIGQIGSVYVDIIEKGDYFCMADLWGDPGFVVWFGIWIAIGAGSAIGFLKTFGKRRMEHTEEVSETWFGYRVLIPVYAACCMLTLSDGFDLITWLIFELFALIGYTIYRRGFHYKKSDIIVLLSLLILLFV